MIYQKTSLDKNKKNNLCQKIYLDPKIWLGNNI